MTPAQERTLVDLAQAYGSPASVRVSGSGRHVVVVWSSNPAEWATWAPYGRYAVRVRLIGPDGNTIPTTEAGD